MRKALDRLIVLLSWSPSSWARLPLVFALAAAPAAYVLMSARRAQGPVGAARQASSSAVPSVPPAVESEAVETYQANSGEDQFPQLWDTMTADLDRAARRFPGAIAIYVKDLKHNREWTYHADDLFPAASLIKVPVMCGVFQKIRDGELSLDTELTLRRSVRMGGSGTLKWQPDGSRFTVRYLLEKLIHESDNTALRMLIDEAGMGFLQRQFPKMGLVYTEIYPEGLSLTSGQVRYENYTTAREMSMLFEKIYKGDMVSRDSSELMLEILKRRRVRSRLAKGLPIGWEIAHKTGLLRRACHDSSIIFSPDGDYVLTVLTGKNQSYSFAKNFITRIGRITYRHYKSAFGLYAKADRGYALGQAAR